MKEIQNKSGKILIIEIPKLAFYFDWNYCKKNYDDFNNPRIQIYWETEDDRVGGFITNFKSAEDFEIVGKLSELTNENCEKFVDYDNDNRYRDYTVRDYQLTTSKQSFISLLKSKSIDMNKEWLIIEIL